MYLRSGTSPGVDRDAQAFERLARARNRGADGVYGAFGEVDHRWDIPVAVELSPYPSNSRAIHLTR